MATEAELHHLYQQIRRAFDREGAATMIEVLGSYARNEPASKADLEVLGHQLRKEMGELRTEMAQMEQRLGDRLTSVFIRSQGITVAIVGLLIAIT